jgi:hypothetical protein
MTANPRGRSLGGRVDFVFIFVAMMLWIVSVPILSRWPLGDALVNVAYFAILALCLGKATISRRWRAAVIGGIALLTVNYILYQVVPDLAYLGPRIALLNLVFVVLAPILMSRLVLAAREVDTNTIFASLCAYFLLAMCWGQAYVIIERVSSGSFSMPAGEADPGSTLLYFSFTTLTTLGYGDVTPRTEFTRVLATLEALTGQVYLVVLVARLVSMHVAQKPSRS